MNKLFRGASYCGIKRPAYNLMASASSTDEMRTLMNGSDVEFATLGSQIIRSLTTGVSPEMAKHIGYDSEDVKGVDVMCSPNHDFFDVAEEFGNLTETDGNAPIPEGQSNDTPTEGGQK